MDPAWQLLAEGPSQPTLPRPSQSDHPGAADLPELRLCAASQSAPRFPKPQEPQPSVAGPREEGHSRKWGRDSNMQGSPEHFLHECRLLTHDTGHTPRVTTSSVRPASCVPSRGGCCAWSGRGTASPGGRHVDVAKNCLPALSHRFLLWPRSVCCQKREGSDQPLSTESLEFDRGDSMSPERVPSTAASWHTHAPPPRGGASSPTLVLGWPH